jgi:hypothetical protein
MSAVSTFDPGSAPQANNTEQADKRAVKTFLARLAIEFCTTASSLLFPLEIL